MSKIRITLDYEPINGKQISFVALRSSQDTDGFIINDVDYDIVDAKGVSVMGLLDIWSYGAMVSVILNTTTHKAYIQNAAMNLPKGDFGAHNSTYRGKYLGAAVTEKQWAAIKAGTFEDLYIGDYWAIPPYGLTYRIAAFDYYLKRGTTSHHLVMLPDQLYKHVMNSSGTSAGAYAGSKMFTEGLEQARTIVARDFGSDHVLSLTKYLQNATVNGYACAASSYTDTVSLMTEQNVYGCKIFGNLLHGSVVPNNYTVDTSQYPIFMFRPDLISNTFWFWLRDVVDDKCFASVGGDGGAGYTNAATNIGVRPSFCIY